MLRPLIRHGLGFANVGRLLWWRARSPRLRGQPFLYFEDRVETYDEIYRKSLHVAHLLEEARRERLSAGRLQPGEPLAVGIYQESTPEFLHVAFGAALCGATLFGINTGFRGETLARLIDQGEMQLLLTEQKALPEVEAVLPDLAGLSAADVIVTDAERSDPLGSARPLAAVLDEVAGRLGPDALARRPSVRLDNLAPFLVIYTSGTTGLPKGVPCSQLKLLGAGAVTARRLGLRRADRAWVAMPLFHSNSWFLGIMPLLFVGGSVVVRRRFTASGFEDDLLQRGITYMNYVGQPIHYILAALERKYGSGQAVTAALATHPDNHFRIAHGNGATPIDREKLVTYLGMEHIYELYGATEAAISTFVKPGDPADSVGEVTSKSIVILDERGQPCPPGRVDAHGRLLNYDRAVGEIARQIGRNNLFFDGYFKNPEASAKKYRDGYFRSGDLGHIRIVGGKRYLYFNGRTDDWIRKDGENFSAENAAHFAARLPGVALAVAYGVPAEVADEHVMVAVKLQDGAAFDPKAAFEWLQEQQRYGGMDPKWMPDYIRVVPQFDMTETQKILVRPLKREHFRPNGEGVVYFRERGDTCYRLLSEAEFAGIEQRFRDNGRAGLLTAP